MVAEYVGCFLEDVNKRVFAHSPGDYRSNELSPVQCMIVCGRTFKYAAVQSGVFCMCSNALPAATAEESKCSSVCPGTVNYPSAIPKCGGADAISVYSIEHRILGLSIEDPGSVKVFERSTFSAATANGKNATFLFDFGDGDASRSLQTKERNISHVYDKPGTYEITLSANNAISGTQQATRTLSVTDDVAGVNITCPRGIMLGQPMECHGELSRGSRTNITVDFGDGKMEHLTLSKSCRINKFTNFL